MVLATSVWREVALPERYDGNRKVQAMPITTGDMSGRKFFAMRFATRLFALLLFASCAAALRAQSIQIKLVDGKTGRPVTSIPWLAPHNIHVGLGRESDLSLVLTTDKQGVVSLRFSRDYSEINVPECTGEHAAWDRLVKNALMGHRNKDDVREFNKKYWNCMNFRVKNPVVRFVDSISIGLITGSNFRYVPCWESPYADGMKDFSTEDILQHGVVTANNCGNATASPQPGQLILFVRPPTQMEAGRQAWN